jgi:FlaA1/EpsC-like NDP-sugar epimerase
MLVLSRRAKYVILVVTDCILLSICAWAALAARMGEWWPEQIAQIWWLFLLAPIAGVATFTYLGMYRNVVRYLGDEFYTNVFQSVSLHVLLLFSALFIAPVGGIPRSVPFIYWLLSMVAIVGSRVVASGLFKRHMRRQADSINTVIFGAGPHGAELARVLQSGTGNNVVAFIDDKRATHGSTIQDVRVYPTSKLQKIISEDNVKLVLLAIPDASKDRLRNVLDLLDEFPVYVKTMPAMSELLSGKASVEDLREIDIEDLLGREPVAPDPGLMRACITGKAVMVTGAGGSIGSELCRQIMILEPKTLALVDFSEYGLYQIERELRELAEREGHLRKIRVIALLASIDEKARLTDLMRELEVDTVYHAAAYKHVPTVESNPVIAVRNNIFGTKKLAEAAAAALVETFIMVSTDKAVRPSSVMGATKNVAEQIIHMIDRQCEKTQFVIVRFGNVIGSSGSVVPLFREQITKGGPVTVTDVAIERYFMTIPEAAQLVIQAGSMGSGGDQYVLDMGQPIKVLDLAKRMIRLSGLHVRDERNPSGDIEIRITGLRPGEKMFEETHHSEDIEPTSHARISKERGITVDVARLVSVIHDMESACAHNDADAVRGLLQVAIPGYTPFRFDEVSQWLRRHVPANIQAIDRPIARPAER